MILKIRVPSPRTHLRNWNRRRNERRAREQLKIADVPTKPACNRQLRGVQMGSAFVNAAPMNCSLIFGMGLGAERREGDVRGPLPA
jgi:hypothetical protein